MNEKTPLTIRKLPAAHGVGWLVGTWALIKRQALRLMLIGLFFQFLLGFSQVQALGLLVVLFLPVLTAGMLHAFYQVELGEKPLLVVLFVAFTDGARISKLLLLGAIVIVVGLFIMTAVLAGQIIDIDPAIVSRIEQGDLDALQLIDPQVLETAVFAMAIGALVSGTISYFSVPLIWFGNVGVGKALVGGLTAMWRNWQPLLVIGLLLGLLALPIILLFVSFYLSALTQGGSSNLVAVLLLVLGPLYQLLLFGTQYVAFRSIFGVEKPASDQSGQEKDQLVA
jgi:hypothetical protein